MSRAPKFTPEQCAEVVVRVTQRCMAGKPPDDQLLGWIDTAVANLKPDRSGGWARRMLEAEFARADTEGPSDRKWIADGWRRIQPTESAMLLTRGAPVETLPTGSADVEKPTLSRRYLPDPAAAPVVA